MTGFYSPFQDAADRETDLMQWLAQDDQRNRGFANLIHKCLAEQIKDFEETLNAEEEIGGYLASFGREIFIRIEEIRWHNPYLLIFSGVNLQTQQKVKLVQHASQINVLFAAVPKSPEHEQARRVGFITENEED